MFIELWLRTNTEVILGPFLPIYSPSRFKNYFSKENKKTPKIHLILQQCTKNCGHMIYCCQGQREGLRQIKKLEGQMQKMIGRGARFPIEGETWGASLYSMNFFENSPNPSKQKNAITLSLFFLSK